MAATVRSAAGTADVRFVRRHLGRAALLVTVLTLVVVGAGSLPSSTVASAASSMTFTGHGFGHGRGLGQYGALGYAVDKGWTHEQILDHYYGGTTAKDVGNPEMTVRLTALDGDTSMTVTSSVAFWVGYGATVYTVPGGQAAKLDWNGSGWTLTVLAGCGGALVGGPAAIPPLSELSPQVGPGTDARAPLTVCDTGRGYRGKLRAQLSGSSTYLVDVVDTESYLRGVVPRESVASWADLGEGKGMNALRAQAVAARSYALSETRYSYAKTCDTTSCQVYGGATLNGQWIEDSRTDTAVSTTAGVVRWKNNAVVRTEFSSSTGGYTAGGAFPAVPDDGDTRSPFHDWSVVVSTADIAADWPAIGDFVRMRVTARNGLGADGGRVTAVEIIGTRSTVTATGNEVRVNLGLRSDWFTPVAPTELVSQLRNSATAGAADATIWFGGPDGQALGCDFLASGRDQLAVYDKGTWYLRATLSGGPADRWFSYGMPGWTAVCGDWDGDGRDGIGVYDGKGTWYLRNNVSAGAADAVISYGWSGGAPVVGDWDGNGTDTIGVWDRSTGNWMVRQTNTPGAPQKQFQYGFTGALPVPGDWNGDGTTDVGVFAKGRWYVRSTFSAGPADAVFDYGLTTDVPLHGDWDGSPGEGIGVSRSGNQ